LQYHQEDALVNQETLDYQKAYDYAMSNLEKGLPEYLKYHDVEHTQMVVRDVERLAKMENTSEEELCLLMTAAAFHDIGFIKSYFDNEKIGAQIAADVLPGFGYSNDQIDIIKGLIISTVFPGQPETHLQKIICDADLFYVGSDIFKTIANGLRFEFEHVGIIKNEEQWLKLQVDFLTSFNLRTESANSLANAGLLINRAEALEDYRKFLEK
jgi:uncharacterized protein